MMMGLKDRQMGSAALGVCVLGTSMSSLLYKLALETGAHPLWVNALRLGIGLVLMAPFILLSQKRRAAFLRVSRRDFLESLLSGVLLACHFTCWTASLLYTDVFAATALWGTYLLMSAALSYLFLHERLSPAAIAGMLIATAGVIVCNIGSDGGRTTGNLLALACALFQALYMMIGRRVRVRVDTTTYTAIVYAATFASLLLGIAVLRVPPTGVGLQTAASTLGLALFCTLGGHTMGNLALKFYRAPTVAAVMLTGVVTGPLMVYFVLGDVPGIFTLIGGLVIVAGLTVTLWADIRGQHLSTSADRPTPQPCPDQTDRTPS